MITVFSPPSGPGVRLNAGYTAGIAVPQAYDSLIGKLIVTGASRAEALERAARALGEFEVGGMPAGAPLPPCDRHRPCVHHTGRLAARAHPLDRDRVQRFAAGPSPASVADPPDREKLTVEVDGKKLEVTVPRRAAVSTARSPERPRRATRQGAAAPAKSTLISPMQGTIIKIAVAEGQQVQAGAVVVVLEAMKMEQPLTAHKNGTITGLSVAIGRTVTSGEAICQIEG